MNTPQKVIFVEYDSVQIIPAPTISISYVPLYANDNLINMTYKVTLSGFLSAYKREGNFQSSSLESQSFTTQANPGGGIQTEDSQNTISADDNETVIVTDDTDVTFTTQNGPAQNAAEIAIITQRIQELRILFKNGKKLLVKDEDGRQIIEAVGGIIKSFSVQNSINSWSRTAPYTVEMEFSYINFFNTNLCGATEISQIGLSGIINYNQYSIKNFTEEWNIDVNNESFSTVLNTENNTALSITNNSINIEYSLSVEGLDYYQSSGTFVPAWESAKIFAQDRLYTKINNIFSESNNSSGDGCSPAKSGNIIPLNNGDYKYEIFNEIITTGFSEIDGTFSVTYSSILKQNNNTNNFSKNNSKHTITKTVNYINKDNRKLFTVSVNGTIEGLVKGGLLQNDKPSFNIPQNGSFLIKSQSSNTDKYKKAKELWDLIKYGSEDDLSDDFKDALGLSYSYMGGESPCSTSTSTRPLPTSFSVSHNKLDGIITYNGEYDSRCFFYNNDRTHILKTITLDKKEQTPMYAEHSLMDGSQFFQDLSITAAKELVFTFSGRKDDYKIPYSWSVIPITHIIGVGTEPVVPPEDLITNFPDYSSNAIIRRASRNIDIITGTYTTVIEYTCGTTGCQP